MADRTGTAASAEAAASSLSRFQRIVLSWDYVGLVAESKEIGPKRRSGLKAVKDTYRDAQEYLSVYEPLLFEEVKAQIIQSRDEDAVTDWEQVATGKCTMADGFHTMLMAADKNFSENDLLLISENKFKEGLNSDAYAFALVEPRGGNVVLRTFLSGEIRNIENNKPEPSIRLRRLSSILEGAENILWILRGADPCRN